MFGELTAMLGTLKAAIEATRSLTETRRRGGPVPQALDGNLKIGKPLLEYTEGVGYRLDGLDAVNEANVASWLAMVEVLTTMTKYVGGLESKIDHLEARVEALEGAGYA